MRRRRTQTGYVYSERGVWFLRFYDDRVIDAQVRRKRLARQLGSCTAMSKAQARKEAKIFLDTVNGNHTKPETAVTVGDFVKMVYFPMIERRGLRPSTVRGYCVIWDKQLDTLCRHFWLRDVRTSTMQRVLDDLANTGRLNSNSLKHAKSFLSGVFRLAIQLDYYGSNHNPVQQASIPKARPADDTYAYSLEEIGAMLAVLPEPAATIVATAAYTGTRRGEIRGLCWENYDCDKGAIVINTSVWQGHRTEPKSRKSRAPVPVIRPLATRFDIHRMCLGNPASGPLFPNGAGKPLDLNNLLSRTILPVLKRNHIEWHGWHAFRRGLATNMHRLGIDDKTIQTILRHANIATTQNIYIKGVDADARAAMAKFESALALSDSQRTVRTADQIPERTM